MADLATPPDPAMLSRSCGAARCAIIRWSLRAKPGRRPDGGGYVGRRSDAAPSQSIGRHPLEHRSPRPNHRYAAQFRPTDRGRKTPGLGLVASLAGRPRVLPPGAPRSAPADRARGCRIRIASRGGRWTAKGLADTSACDPFRAGPENLCRPPHARSLIFRKFGRAVSRSRKQLFSGPECLAGRSSEERYRE
jgi:hypothetical protein